MAPSFRRVLSLATILPLALAVPAPKGGLDATAVKEKSYDYIIVGGGLTGLVVANRLTENKDRSVLVIENGYLDDDISTVVPSFANSNNVARMYDITSAPEPLLDNKTFPTLVGNIVGGSSVINGMAFDRASAADYDAWEKLGNVGWGWKDLLVYFKKSTTFTPPLPSVAEEFNITYDASYYGTDGPVGASFPNFEYQDMKAVWASYRTEDIQFPEEHASGAAVGAIWLPQSMYAKTQTRSHARNAYYDPIKSRTNLNLVTGQRVNEILFDGLKAKGVQFVSRADESVTRVYAKREVILAAGAIFTPQVLQLSGIGPKNVLKSAGVKVKKNFPAVGTNLQDHPNANVIFDVENLSFPNPMSLSDPAYNASAWAEYMADRTGPHTQAHGNSLAFLDLQTITKEYKSLVQTFKTQNALDFLPAEYKDHNLLRGFEAQRAVLAELLLSKDAAAGEIPMVPMGMAISAVQKPLSRGSITLDPDNKYGNPIVFFNALQNPLDKKMLVEMIRWTRRHWARKELAQFSPVETTPGVAAQTDNEIIDALLEKNAIAATWGHQTGSCSMLPEKYGGVVGSDLLVYGTKHLSIIDASIMPLIPATHPSATMYAIAEKAADLIKARNM